MASCSQHHKTLNAEGIGKCSKPMWDGYGGPNGFCDAPAYGEQVGTRSDYFVPYLACPRHGGPDAPKKDCTP